MRSILLSFVLLFCSSPAVAFDYFGSDINYWQNQSAAAQPGPNHSDPASPADKPKFDWKKALDPNAKEFFQEGDYTPPAPFMELVRDPSDENIQNWFSLIEKKNELAARLQKRVQEYVSKNGGESGSTGEKIIKTSASQVTQSADDYKRYRFRLYYRSTCPHCRRMIETLNEIQAKGYFVEVRQVDRDQRAVKNLPFPVSFADEGELKEKGINSTPVLFVGDAEKKVVYRINGYHTAEEIFSTIKARQNL